MAFLGMRGTGNWVANQRPENWRQMILRLYPNGQAPLTAIMSKMGEERVDDPHYHWWTKGLPLQAGAIDGMFTDAAFAAPYAVAAAAGTQVWVNVTALVASEFRHGHIVMLRDASDLTLDVVGRVESVIVNGANSAICVLLLEADNNSAVGGDLSDADRILVIGNSNPEGGEMPDTVAYDPVEWYNYTQIFRTPLEITRTARETRLRTGPQYQESKRECLELHSIEIEKAFLWGIRTLRTGHNNQPERTTLGLVNAIRLGAPGNVFDYTSDPAYSLQAWITGGEHWMDTCMEQIFRFGGKEKLALVGSQALLAITRLAKAAGTVVINPVNQTNMTWGIAVQHWETNFGTIHLISHPLFNYEPTMRNMCVITEPKLLKVRYITDTTFFGMSGAKKAPDGQSFGRMDGTKEEFLSEIGLEYHHPTAMGILTGLGTANTVP